MRPPETSHLRVMDTTGPNEQPVKFFMTMIGCSVGPFIINLFLPEPWHSAVLPFVAFLLVFGFFFGLALALHGLSVIWRLIWPHKDQALRCPSCLMVEQPWFRFVVVRVAPSIYRLHCSQCGERWVERR